MRCAWRRRRPPAAGPPPPRGATDLLVFAAGLDAAGGLPQLRAARLLPARGAARRGAARRGAARRGGARGWGAGAVRLGGASVERWAVGAVKPPGWPAPHRRSGAFGAARAPKQRAPKPPHTHAASASLKSLASAGAAPDAAAASAAAAPARIARRGATRCCSARTMTAVRLLAAARAEAVDSIAGRWFRGTTRKCEDLRA
jgi:hypothetical protein